MNDKTSDVRVHIDRNGHPNKLSRAVRTKRRADALITKRFIRHEAGGRVSGIGLNSFL